MLTRRFLLPVLIVLILAAPRSGITQDKRPLANSDPNYRALRDATLKDAVVVENLVLQRDVAKFTLRSGTIAFLAPVLDRVPGAVFVGEGRFELEPAIQMERPLLNLITGKETVDEEFTSLVL